MMIELRYESGVAYWVNPNHIMRIETAYGEDRTESIVYMINGEKYRCQETPNDILALINPPAPAPTLPSGVYAGAVGGAVVGGGGGAGGFAPGYYGAGGGGVPGNPNTAYWIVKKAQLLDQADNG